MPKRKLSAWQKHVKSYMASHKGLSFKEALPKAKLTYRKGSNPNPRPSKKARKVKNVVRRRYSRKRNRKSRQFTIPLAPIAGLIGGMASPIRFALMGNLEGALNEIAYNYIGFYPPDMTFDPNRLKRGLLPLILGCAIHKFVGGWPLNVNRYLKDVPFIRI